MLPWKGMAFRYLGGGELDPSTTHVCSNSRAPREPLIAGVPCQAARGCDPSLTPAPAQRRPSLCQHRHQKLWEQLCVLAQAPKSRETLMPLSSPVIKTVLPPEVRPASWQRPLPGCPSCPASQLSCEACCPLRWEVQPGHTRSGSNSRSTTAFQMGEDSYYVLCEFSLFQVKYPLPC